MQAKIEAALYAISKGVFSVVIASGCESNVILNITNGARVGTLFVAHPEKELASARQMANEVQHFLSSLMNGCC